MAVLHVTLFLASVCLQVAAVAFAVLMARRSRVRTPWVLLAAALGAMAVYRIVGTASGTGILPWSDDTMLLATSIAAFIISLLFFIALPAISRLSQQEESAATARREVENRLALLINHMPAEIFIKSVEGRYIMANQRMLQSLGLPLERVIGYAGKDIHPELHQTLSTHLEAVRRTQVAITREYKFDRNGHVRDMLTTICPLFDPASKMEAFCGISVDVTALKEAQRSLVESQRFVSRVLATTPDLVYVLDTAERRITYKNRTFRSFLGHAVATDDPGMDESFVLHNLHPDDRHVYDDLDQRFAGLDDGAAIDVEFRMMHADGTYHWVAARETVFTRNDDGSVRQILGTAEDVTGKRLAEAERDRLLEQTRLAREEAESANRAKDRFLAVLSHELRTPLNPVLMSVSMHAADPSLPRPVRDSMEMIRQNIALEVRLIDDLLDIGRIRNGKMRVDLQPARVNALIEQAVRICQDDIREAGLTITTIFDAAHDTVRADPARLQQVFWNLLKNAIKFTPAGGSITIASRNTDAGIEIRVTDTGIGIAPALQPRLFDAFEQGELVGEKQLGGLGLGLAIARAVIERHAGTIRVHSEGEGRGSTFTISLPTEFVVSETARLPKPEVSKPATCRRLLLVEDHDDTRKVLSKMLQVWGYEVTTAKSMADALRSLDDQRVDLLISDIGLPDADGYELMRQVRAKYDIKGICMTGYGMDEDIRKSREAGFVDHIVKPVDAQRLREVVAQVVQ